MLRKRIGVLLIGQRPRPDLVDPLHELLPDYEILCIVLDYVGYTREGVQQLQSKITVPVLDLGYLALRTLASSLTTEESMSFS